MELSDYFDVRSTKGSLMLVVTGLILISISGLFFAVYYYFINLIQTSLLTMSCQIPGNAFFNDCQGWFTFTVYPFLNLKVILIYLSFFSIFILTIGMLLVGYQSGTNHSLLGVLVIIEIMMVYGAIEISNIYRTLLDNEIIRTAMIPFGVYNTVMLYFPWFVFVISLFSIALGIVNWQRSPVNTATEELNY